MKFYPNSEKDLEIDGNILHFYFFDYDKNKPFVFFLHGLRADTSRNLPIIKEANKKFNVISFDLPGFGKSSSYERKENYVEYCAKLLPKIFKELQAPRDKTVLFGASNGANIIVDFALRNETSDFRTIVLFAPIYSYKFLSMNKNYKRFVDWFTVKMAKGGTLNKIIQKGCSTDWTFNVFSKMTEPDCRKSREVLDYERSQWRLMTMQHWGKTLYDFLHIDLTESSIVLENKNIIFVYPEKDQYLDIPKTVESFSRMFPHAKLAYYPSDKHIPRGDFMKHEGINKAIQNVLEQA